MWEDELTPPGSIEFPSFEACCKHGKIKMLTHPNETPFPLFVTQAVCSLSVTVVVDPTLCGATSLPPYVKVYDDCAEFYSTFFPPGVIVMARETPELFAKSAILASHNTSVVKLNNDILATMGPNAQQSVSVDTAEEGPEK